MKRYLIEPKFVTMHEPGVDTAPGSNSPPPMDKPVYRIIDTATGQAVPPTGENIAVIARACANLNEVVEKAEGAPSKPRASGYVGTADSLPDDIVQSIAISNAQSIEDQPSILANLDLAQQIFNQNMRQQNAVAQQQAMNLIRLAVAAKCVGMIENADGSDEAAIEKIGRNAEKLFQDLSRSIDRNAGDSPSP